MKSYDFLSDSNVTVIPLPATLEIGAQTEEEMPNQNHVKTPQSETPMGGRKDKSSTP
ncbi:uncharacterized protein TRIREDRAFT_110128 [Trichoderma reesei QM6a]|uniref:Predicted protein n=2 Tax=Hypocrea jecorina TaxID=51453 RepID=G0RR99_HYPJQ|nr:uncharacterized protein TRIREDRAFT_110128 [Trichoderma reesei QM6a]EGR46218.1 predicted protein [Trichoderma reesei QM6a]ETR99216.1 hypothetical protein M419DRAFT_132551 [Trichoderma reesei RUT C-30]